MAICWTTTINQLDGEFVFSPERYSARRDAFSTETKETVPLSTIAHVLKSTTNPANSDSTGRYVVLDTTHAVEGRIQFHSRPSAGADVGSVKRPVAKGSVMVSRLRTYLRQVAYVDEGLIDRYGVPVVCSTEFYMLEPTEGKSIAFLVPFLLSDPVQKIFANAQEGGHHPRIHLSVLMGLRIPKSLLSKREKISEKVIEAIDTMRAAERMFEDCAAAVVE